MTEVTLGQILSADFEISRETSLVDVLHAAMQHASQKVESVKARDLRIYAMGVAVNVVECFIGKVSRDTLKQLFDSWANGFSALVQ